MGEAIEINKQRYPAGKYKAVDGAHTEHDGKAFSFNNVLNERGSCLCLRIYEMHV